jgi:hypothetical protein
MGIFFGLGFVLVAGETEHLLHRDGPKQVHTEHHQFPSPERPSFTVVESGVASGAYIRIIPGSGNLTITGSASFMA